MLDVTNVCAIKYLYCLNNNHAFHEELNDIYHHEIILCCKTVIYDNQLNYYNVEIWY